MGGQHQNTARKARGFYAPDDFKAIEPWQAQIKNNQIDMMLAGHLNSVHPAIGFPHDVIAVIAQDGAHGRTD